MVDERYEPKLKERGIRHELTALRIQHDLSHDQTSSRVPNDFSAALRYPRQERFTGSSADLLCSESVVLFTCLGACSIRFG